MALSSPCVHPTNHCLLAVMGLLELCSLALRAPVSLSHIVTLASYCKGQGHGMPTHHYFGGPKTIHSFLEGHCVIFCCILLFLSSPVSSSHLGPGNRWGGCWRWERWGSAVSSSLQLSVSSAGSQQVLHCLVARGGPHVEHHTSGAAKDVILEKIFHFFKGHQGSNMGKSNI